MINFFKNGKLNEKLQVLLIQFIDVRSWFWTVRTIHKYVTTTHTVNMRLLDKLIENDHWNVLQRLKFIISKILNALTFKQLTLYCRFY